MPSQPLPARLARYVAQVREILAQPLSPATTLRRVREAARELVAEPLPLPAADRRHPPQGYGRNLLYRDPDHGFVVIAMVWPPGQGGPPHDHGCWGVVAVSEGEVEVTNFERQDDGSDPARIALEPLGTIQAAPGAVAWVLPPHEDFHSVLNPSSERLAITLHTYALEPLEFNKVDLQSGAAGRGRLIYDNA